MYIVASGFSFSTKRGVIAEGKEITEKDFASHEAFVRAVSKKKIIVGKPEEQTEKDAAQAAEKAKQEQDAAEKKAKAEALTAARNKKGLFRLSYG
jgi:hypothetical protein